MLLNPSHISHLRFSGQVGAQHSYASSCTPPRVLCPDALYRDGYTMYHFGDLDDIETASILPNEQTQPPTRNHFMSVASLEIFGAFLPAPE
jgi:hypothetical protein